MKNILSTVMESDLLKIMIKIKPKKKDKKVDEKKVFLVEKVDSKQNIHDILSM